MRERERGGSSDTCSLSLSLSLTLDRGVFLEEGRGKRCLLLFDQRGARREKRSGILRDFLCLFVKYGPCEGMCCLFTPPPIPILSFSQVRVHRIRVPSPAVTGVRLSAPNWRERRSWGQWGWEDGVGGGVVCFCEDVFLRRPATGILTASYPAS